MFDSSKFVVDFMGNWERFDLAGALACISDDATFKPDLLSEPVVGREAIAKLWSYYMEMMQGYEMTLVHVVGTENVAFLERIEHVVTPKNEKVDLPICGVFEFDENHKIKAWRDYVESTTMP